MPSLGNDILGIWVIEDDPVFRRGLVELLGTTPGMAVERSFEACEEALEAVEAGGAPRIVLVDLGLPGMGGIEGIRRMKTLSPGTEFIVLTIHEEHQNVFGAICAGATGYLLKSLPPEEIVAKVREVMVGGAPMNPQIARQVLRMLSGAGAEKGTYGLTDREREVLNLMVEGLSRKEIAERLFISPSTIMTHSRNIYAKLHVHTRAGVVAKALKEKLL
jgi:DNA-binding NarL/FixJ family response regulator